MQSFLFRRQLSARLVAAPRSLQTTVVPKPHHIIIRTFINDTTKSPKKFDPKLPLSGVRVVDMTRVLAGPYCTQILADLGAEVIKIEHPTRGDDTRAWGPPFAKYKEGTELTASQKTHPGEAAYFLGVNRNKKSIGLNFRDPKGQAILRDLISKSDVLIENYVPGTLAKYNLAYEQLPEEVQKNLIYASITGYGQTGPYAKRPGYDVMVEAEFGLMHITGEPQGSPVKVGVAVTDLTTGLYAANAIMASLLHGSRNTTPEEGKGQYLDICLADCQVVTLANIASSCLISGKPDSGRQGTEHPSICPYQGFQTGDGKMILVAGGNDAQYQQVCQAIGRQDLGAAPEYQTNALRVTNRKVLVKEIQDTLLTKPIDEWLDIFSKYKFPYAPVNDVQQTLNHPQIQARNMIEEIEHPACGPIKLINHPVKYSKTQPVIRTAPPLLGQDTSHILNSILGYETEEIEELQSNGVVN